VSLPEAVERARDAHRHVIALADAASRGDLDAVATHREALDNATSDVQKLVDEATEGER